MALTNSQRSRYARQLVLDAVGQSGQEKLLASRVLIIGAGGLGSPAALYLAAAGVGTLGIADSDTVELSNLQRQILHGSPGLGVPKVDSARDAIARLNPEVRVNTHLCRVRADNIMALVKDYDFVIDAADNFSTKLLISDACVLARKPFCHGAIARFYGQLMTYVPGRGPCYRCLCRTPPADGGKPEGVLGVVAGTVGCLQAAEAIKYLLGAGELLTGTLLTFDALDMSFERVRLREDPACPACGAHPSPAPAGNAAERIGPLTAQAGGTP